LHIIQRGNNRQACFYADEDCRKYLEWLEEYAAKTGCLVNAYVLMTNHVHLLVSVADGGSAGGGPDEGVRPALRAVPEPQLSAQRHAVGRTVPLVPRVGGGVSVYTSATSSSISHVPGWSSYRMNAQGEADMLVKRIPATKRWDVTRQAARQHIANCFAMTRNPAWWTKSGGQRTGTMLLGKRRFAKQVAAALGRRGVPGKSGRPRKAPEAESTDLFEA